MEEPEDSLSLRIEKSIRIHSCDYQEKENGEKNHTTGFDRQEVKGTVTFLKEGQYKVYVFVTAIRYGVRPKMLLLKTPGKEAPEHVIMILLLRK